MPYLYSIERGVVMAGLSALALAPTSSGGSPTAPASSVKPSLEPRQESAGPAQVRYLSPVISIDPEAGLALLQVRNAESGDVRFQLPPEHVVREYKSTEAATSRPSANKSEPQAQASTAADAATSSSLKSADPAEAKQG
jgi:hypothetical protein